MSVTFLTKSMSHLGYAARADRRDNTIRNAPSGANAFIASSGGGSDLDDRGVIRLRIGYSLLALAVASVLAAWFVVPSGSADPSAGSLVGPATWPRAMLIGIAICSALLTLRNVVAYVGPRQERKAAVSQSAEEFDNRKAAVGIALLVLYAVAMPTIGFALATVAFFLVWLPFGAVRKPHVVAAVAVIGTVALLYVFVKLTTLPLDRGIGLFDGVTVAIYRALGIY